MVREWTNERPKWLEVLEAVVSDDPAFQFLDSGENSALTPGRIWTNFRYRHELFDEMLRKYSEDGSR